jgi:hypothetical protein
VLVFFHNYISRWDFSLGKQFEGECHGCVPTRSKRELTLGRPPACRNDFLIMQPVLGIANPPLAQRLLLQLTPQPLAVIPRVAMPSPMPSTQDQIMPRNMI